MDDLARGRRVLLTLEAALGLAACAATSTAPVGVSSPKPAARSEAVAPSVATPDVFPVPHATLSTFRSQMRRAGERFMSHGHGDRFDALLWLNDAANSAWGGDGAFPEESGFVEEAIAHGASGDRPEGLLIMVKHGASWTFAALAPNGDAASAPQVATCPDCHREAPRDFVFRLR